MPGIPRLDAVSVDATVILFTFGVALVTGLVFGIVPALHATRTALSGSLKEGGRGAVTSRGGTRARGVLVVAEMALAVMLLAGAGLLMRSFLRLQSVDPGFNPAQALSFELSLPMVLVLCGVAAGTITALFVSQTMAKMLFSVTPTDPVTFAAVAAVLVGVALFASYLPARRSYRRAACGIGPRNTRNTLII